MAWRGGSERKSSISRLVNPWPSCRRSRAWKPPSNPSLGVSMRNAYRTAGHPSILVATRRTSSAPREGRTVAARFTRESTAAPPAGEQRGGHDPEKGAPFTCSSEPIVGPGPRRLPEPLAPLFFPCPVAAKQRSSLQARPGKPPHHPDPLSREGTRAGNRERFRSSSHAWARTPAPSEVDKSPVPPEGRSYDNAEKARNQSASRSVSPAV